MRLAIFLWAACLLADDSKPTLAGFGFMTGHWRCEIWGGSGEEIWTTPADGSMLGMFRFSKGGKLAFTEFLTFEDTADGPALYMRHFNPLLKAWEDKDGALLWKVAERKANEALFVREGISMRYTLESADVLVAVLKKTKDGKTEESVFRYLRVKPPVI